MGATSLHTARRCESREGYLRLHEMRTLSNMGQLATGIVASRTKRRSSSSWNSLEKLPPVTEAPGA